MKDHQIKILTLPIRVALVILLFGVLFKVMHWPYATELMFNGGILLGVLYTIRFMYKTNKKQLDYVKLAFVLLWLFNYLVQDFHFFNLPLVLEICPLILFLWWFINEGLTYFNNRKFKIKGFVRVIYYVLIGMTSFALFFGLLFKIQHWPYGSELFVSGIVLLNTILIVDYFLFKRV